jgi:ParB family chromosome partitioning protein
LRSSAASVGFGRQSSPIFKAVPCIIRTLTNEEVLDIQIHENLHREDVHPIDEAFGYKFLQDKLSCNIAELALRVGKTESYVLNRLKLNQLIKEAQDDIDAGILPLVYALEIAKYPPETQAGDPKESRLRKNQLSRLGTWKMGNTKARRKTKLPFNSFQAWIKNNVLYQLSSAVFDRKGDVDLAL